MHKPYKKQSGLALIMFLTIFLLSSTGILLYRLNNRTGVMLEKQAQTARALAQAKEALIGYAATYAQTHIGQPQGYLPCPDSDGDGSAETSCGKADDNNNDNTGHSVIGRFPWRTLGLPPLRDGSGECLWYAVSGTYKNNPKVQRGKDQQGLADDTSGLFIVKNADNVIIAPDTPEERAIAVIFAPGRPIGEQDRRSTGNTTFCGEDAIATNYLDDFYFDAFNGIRNATGDKDIIDETNDDIFAERTSISNFNFWVTSLPEDTPTFIQSPLTKQGANISFNDTLMLITPKDFEYVYSQMALWVAKQVKKCLNQYALNTGQYPWAARLELDPSNPNECDYDDDSGERFGRIPQAWLKENSPSNWEQQWLDATLTSALTSVPPMAMADVWPIVPELKIDLETVQTNGAIKLINLLSNNKLRLLEEKTTQEKTVEELLTEKLPNQDQQNDLLTGFLRVLDKYRPDIIIINLVTGIGSIDSTKLTNGLNVLKTTKLTASESSLLTTHFTQAWEQEALLEEVVKELEKYRCFSENAGLDKWEWGWWPEWKEKVFFVISSEKSPLDDLSGTPKVYPSTNPVPTPSGIPKVYPPTNANLIVLVAGRKLLLNEGIQAGSPNYPRYKQYQQTRSLGTDKIWIKNYLEGKEHPDIKYLRKIKANNLGLNIPKSGKDDTIPPGNEKFFQKEILPGYFNDIVCADGAGYCRIP